MSSKLMVVTFVMNPKFNSKSYWKRPMSAIILISTNRRDCLPRPRCLDKWDSDANSATARLVNVKLGRTLDRTRTYEAAPG